MDLEQETASLLIDFIDDGAENINTEELITGIARHEKTGAMSQL